MVRWLRRRTAGAACHHPPSQFGPHAEEKVRRSYIAAALATLLKRLTRSSPPPNAETALPLNTTGEAETAPPLNTTVENALRGTRLAVMDPAIGGDLYLYYQTFDGRLHITSQSVAHVWQGTIEMNIEDAKLGTPLCAGASYANDSILVCLVD